MSIDINWEALGPAEHSRLSNNIRDFLHAQFQQMPLPSYIANVNVLAFDLGSSSPELEIKHIGDPYPEFYEDDSDPSLFQQQQQSQDGQPKIHSPAPSYSSAPVSASSSTSNMNGGISSSRPSSSGLRQLGSASNIRFRNPRFASQSAASSAASSSSVSSGIPFFHPILTPPLIRSPPLHTSFPRLSATTSLSPSLVISRRNSDGELRQESGLWDESGESIGSNAPSSLSSEEDLLENAVEDDDDDDFVGNTVGSPTDSRRFPSYAARQTASSSPTPTQQHHQHQQPPPFSVREEDLQFLLRVVYKGDVRIVITTTLRLNYPAPGFLTLPVRLTVTGFEIDAMAVLAYISRRVHFSFISDVGNSGSVTDGAMSSPSARHFEVLRNIKVESEIGDQEGKGSVLKNVGKVERFVLDRLRAIVRDELAWPGWITFEF
ncbi:uncharacterized protein V2V93DRAFT_57806 [Kockiozyma suomiensis]|uniref:uncharacterized protein n=1 Tax=Kockiozyma suomiensis TaxID=1337062 RepID=UPI0033432EB8